LIAGAAIMQLRFLAVLMIFINSISISSSSFMALLDRLASGGFVMPA
jgi:hypothetical protein